ncbi:hypothetical protein ACFYWY_35165 [Streptomyces sp. NPDC002870]|uniref:hypothetical protein n=1 Tax=Streptomyces sp. NPDC002870 TaxID=3364666 RepID=UPI00367FB36B
MAHVKLVGQTFDGLTPSGAQAAHNALIELVKGVLRQKVDGTEPRLALTLAQAAKDLVDSRLADPDLSPSMLARELNVSVRTLHRAFAAAEETIAGYIRRSRLEQARLDLVTPKPSPYARGTPGSLWRMPQDPWGTRALAPSTSAKRLRLAGTVKAATGVGGGPASMDPGGRARPSRPERPSKAGPDPCRPHHTDEEN